MTDDEDNGACRLAFETALEKGLDYCADPETRVEVTKPFFGFERGSGPDCSEVLDQGLNAASTMEETRRWVHCRTNELIETDGLDFEEASRRAWDEADDERQPLPSSADDSGLDDLVEDDDGIGMTDPDLEIEDSPF